MMNIWAIIILISYGIKIGMALILDGKPREGKHNFFITFIGAASGIFILYKAGLFN